MRKNPKINQYLKAENAYLRAIMADTDTLQLDLAREMQDRLLEGDCSGPVR